jgi:hypothetical protein
LLGRVVSFQGAYVKHIESQARARVQLKGRRTDNPAEQAEDDEEMHLLIIATNKQVRARVIFLVSATLPWALNSFLTVGVCTVIGECQEAVRGPARHSARGF